MPPKTNKMKGTIEILLAVAATTVAAAEHATTYGGTGPYTSYYHEDPTLINHTFYQPLSSAYGAGSLKLPVIIFANGGCGQEGLAFRALLGEVASYGAMAIANGPAYVDQPDITTVTVTATTSTTTSATAAVTSLVLDTPALLEVLDWLDANAGQGDYANVDGSRVAVWGQSCGGLEAYSVAEDPRVSHVGVFDSGQLTNESSIEIAGTTTKPIFYFLGGPTDVAYPNGERDYSTLPDTTPAWIGNHALGHSGSFDVPNAGPAGIAGTRLMQWLLRGNETAKDWFIGGGANQTGFGEIEFQNLGDIQVTPIQ